MNDASPGPSGNSRVNFLFGDISQRIGQNVDWNFFFIRLRTVCKMARTVNQLEQWILLQEILMRNVVPVLTRISMFSFVRSSDLSAILLSPSLKN